MRQHLSLDVDRATVSYLTQLARRETNGNVSALVDRIARQAWLEKAVEDEAAWHKAHPGFFEDAEIERAATGVA